MRFVDFPRRPKRMPAMRGHFEELCHAGHGQKDRLMQGSRALPQRGVCELAFSRTFIEKEALALTDWLSESPRFRPLRLDDTLSFSSSQVSAMVSSSRAQSRSTIR